MLQKFGNRSADICLVMQAVGPEGHFLSLRILKSIWSGLLGHLGSLGLSLTVLSPKQLIVLRPKSFSLLSPRLLCAFC